jgi:hypothetical protein
MGNHRSLISFSVGVLGLLGCGSSNNSTPDAAKPIDAPKPIDAAPPPIDAPPDAAPVFDFTCVGTPLPTTAPATITIAGLTGTLGIGTLAPLGGVTVNSFKTGTSASINTVTSDMTAGATLGTFTTGDLQTGLVPLDGYVEGTIGGATAYRTTFVFPPDPLNMSLTGIPIPMVTVALFTQLGALGIPTQVDDTNGFLLVQVTDCAGTAIDNATLTVKQGTADVGTIVPVPAIAMQPGTFFVVNVPDGSTDVGATFNGMTFRTHPIIAFKKNATDIANGSISATFVRPGP